MASEEEEFGLILSKIFHSKRTECVIGRMRTQSKDYETSRFPFKGVQNERFVARSKQVVQGPPRLYCDEGTPVTQVSVKTLV